jgi:hypothetical protein
MLLRDLVLVVSIYVGTRASTNCRDSVGASKSQSAKTHGVDIYVAWAYLGAEQVSPIVPAPLSSRQARPIEYLVLFTLSTQVGSWVAPAA